MCNVLVLLTRTKFSNNSFTQLYVFRETHHRPCILRGLCTVVNDNNNNNKYISPERKYKRRQSLTNSQYDKSLK